MDGTCTDPAFPYCDFDGAVGGTAGECVAVTCSPGDVKECSGSSALTCNSTGDGYDLDACSIGCSDGPPPHCKYLQPSYMPDACDMLASAPSLSFTNSGTFDPNVDSNCNGGVFNQPGAPSICVVRYGTITVPAAVTLAIVGTKTTLGRAIAFVADTDLVIDGVVDAGAHGSANGPGGGFFQSGGEAMAGSNYSSDAGGGGAGAATAGGDGGTGTVNGGAYNSGSAATNPGLLTYFAGGASFTRENVGDDQASVSLGGGGGGVLLVSCHGVVSISGTVNAGGGGGQSGVPFFVPLPGFGGGAGGTVVVQGLGIDITGQVFANGGGGGGGIGLSNLTGSNGADALLSDSQAAPGGNNQSGAGVGGFGGYIGNTPYFGTMPSSGSATPGGGGGSVGFLLTYTPTGVTPTITPAHVSPAFQPNGTVQTR
jgi:hypothetical protein